jgi:serine/threonine protein kinase
VEHQSGRQGYLKALDFSMAFQAPDLARELQAMTAAYNFERDLLAKCKDRRLDRVVTPLADGTVKAPGNFGLLENVCYLIFDKAKGDIRDEVAQFAAFDLAWCLRSLHNSAVGLQQLHSTGIAHQDLKPSNVLVFHDFGFKIADLGRASDSSVSSPSDGCQIPGDIGYAPPEQFYNVQTQRTFPERCIGDLYLLGSLFFFYFANCSTTQAIGAKIRGFTGINFTNTDFDNDLPYIRHAFQEALLDLEAQIRPLAGALTPSIMELVFQLCEPDPKRRGHRRNIGSLVPQHSLERFISALDLLAHKAELKMI